MKTPNGSASHYRVVYSEYVRASFRELLTQAKEIGNLTEIEAAARTIHGHLQTQPLIFGEPFYTFHHLGLQARKAIVRPLVVTYSVDPQHHLVYVVLPFKALSQ